MINKVAEDTQLAIDIQEAEFFRCIVDGEQNICGDEQLVILFWIVLLNYTYAGHFRKIL